jgi:hypothetical protein
LLVGGVVPLNDGGAIGLMLEYNGFDVAAGQPLGLERDAHLTVGDFHFVDASSGNYALALGSAAIGKGPPAQIDGLTQDYLGNPRTLDGAYDLGAFQWQAPK